MEIDLIKPIAEDALAAVERGLSLEMYCMDHGIDYYELEAILGLNELISILDNGYIEKAESDE